MTPNTLVFLLATWGAVSLGAQLQTLYTYFFKTRGVQTLEELKIDLLIQEKDRAIAAQKEIKKDLDEVHALIIGKISGDE